MILVALNMILGFQNLNSPYCSESKLISLPLWTIINSISIIVIWFLLFLFNLVLMNCKHIKIPNWITISWVIIITIVVLCSNTIGITETIFRAMSCEKKYNYVLMPACLQVIYNFILMSISYYFIDYNCCLQEQEYEPIQ